MNTKPLTPGTLTHTMECGHVLEVVVIGSQPAEGWMGDEYDVVYVGEKKVCLDFGQNWFAEKGYRFTARQIHFDTAKKHLANG